MKVVGIPKAFGRLFRLVVPIHREERDDSSESLSKGDLAKQGTFGAKLQHRRNVEAESSYRPRAFLNLLAASPRKVSYP